MAIGPYQGLLGRLGSPSLGSDGSYNKKRACGPLIWNPYTHSIPHTKQGSRLQIPPKQGRRGSGHKVGAHTSKPCFEGGLKWCCKGCISIPNWVLIPGTIGSAFASPTPPRLELVWEPGTLNNGHLALLASGGIYCRGMHSYQPGAPIFLYSYDRICLTYALRRCW